MPRSKRKSRSKTAACNKPISTTIKCCECSSRRKLKFTSSRASRIPRASANPAFLPSRLRSRTRFLPPPASASAACRFARAISPAEARPNHDREKNSPPSLATFLVLRGLRRFLTCRGSHRHAARCPSNSEVGRERFPRSIFANLQSVYFSALPELPSRRRLTSARRRQPRPLAICEARQRRSRRLRHALRHLPPIRKSARREYASGKSEVVAPRARNQNGFRWPHAGRTLSPAQRSQADRRPLAHAVARTCFLR